MATATKKSATSKAAAWDKVQALVKQNQDELKAMPTHRELYAWAKENKLNTTTLFPLFKRELKKRGVDYEDLRAQARQKGLQELAENASEAPELVLWIYTDAEHGVFAVCSDDGRQAWYGDFFEEDRIYKGDGDQVRADLSAADKAVFLAGKARDEIDAEAVRLTIRTANHEVTAEMLAGSALGHKALVTVEVTDGDHNPATEWVEQPGFASWRDINLEKLFPEIAE